MRFYVLVDFTVGGGVPANHPHTPPELCFSTVVVTS